MKNKLLLLEKELRPFKTVITLALLIMVITLSYLTIQFFDKQEQIIEKGGYTDGKIRCVCTQEAYDECIDTKYTPLQNINFTNG